MATFDPETQKGPTPTVAGVVEECGYFDLTTSTDISEPSLSIPTKMAYILGGHGVTNDGCACFAEPQTVSSGLAVFTRLGPAVLTNPRLYYTLWGK
jgi:hypothetical protein